MTGIAPAASVVLVQDAEPPFIFAVERSRALRFLGGFYAFPGGKVHTTDVGLVASRTPASGASPDDSGQVAAAVRELFEETGVLLARDPSGGFPHATAELADRRRDLMEGRVLFPDLLRDLRLAIHSTDLAPVGSLVTPAFTAIRFDTAFFIARMPPTQRAEVWPGELQSGEWSTAEALLKRWKSGDCLVSPPSVLLLQAMAGRASTELTHALQQALRDIRSADGGPIHFSPGTEMVPLRTAALPPSNHTHAFLVGSGPTYLIDPGPEDPSEQARLFTIVERHEQRAGKLSAILLTHHHVDHIGAATACAQRYGLPVWAHRRTAEALAGRVRVDRFIHDAERFSLGLAPDGRPDWFLQAVETPGHAAGHLAFYDPMYQVIFAGDLVSTQTSVVIGPTDGDLAQYLASLRRLSTLPCRLLLPSHGPPTSRPAELIRETLLHRQRREAELLEALNAAPQTVAELVAGIYRGVPADLLQFAEFQVQAGLRKLANEGRVSSRTLAHDEQWFLTDKAPG